MTAMKSISIRDANRHDLPAIIALLADDDLGKSREVVSEEIDPAYVRAFEVLAADPRTRLMVAEEAGRIVGCFELVFIPGLTRRGAERAQIEAVRVAKDVRGDGLGKLMMTWAINHAKSRGCRLIQLTSDKRRSRAHQFYTKLGFEQTHEGFKMELSQP
jgi:GNAT superfamily N-acetyltransferase